MKQLLAFFAVVLLAGCDQGYQQRPVVIQQQPQVIVVPGQPQIIQPQIVQQQAAPVPQSSASVANFARPTLPYAVNPMTVTPMPKVATGVTTPVLEKPAVAAPKPAVNFATTAQAYKTTPAPARTPTTSSFSMGRTTAATTSRGK